MLLNFTLLSKEVKKVRQKRKGKNIYLVEDYKDTWMYYRYGNIFFNMLFKIVIRLRFVYKDQLSQCIN